MVSKRLTMQRKTMINYKLIEDRLHVEKLWGVVIETHPKYKSIAFFIGRKTHLFWIGYRK